MKQIIREFSGGSSTKKLAIAADFATVLGISVATLVAGPFLSRFADIEFDLADFLISILFYFACIWLGGELFLSAIRNIFVSVEESRYRETMKQSVLLIVYVWLLVALFPTVRYYVGNALEVSYLLPEKADVAITSARYSISSAQGDFVAVEGVAEFKEGADPSDYVAVVYVRNDNLMFEIIDYGRTYRREYEIQLGTDGAVLLPVHESELDGQGALAFYRKSDWSFLRAIEDGPGFPTRVPQVPSTSMSELGAYVVPFTDEILGGPR